MLTRFSLVPLLSPVTLATLAALSLASGAAHAETVYGGATCPTASNACNSCTATQPQCNILGETTGPRTTCAASGPGDSPRVSGPAGGAHVLSSPSAYLLHWGTYWGSHATEASGDVTAWQAIGTDWRFWQPLSEYSPGINYTASTAIPFGAQTVATALPAMSAASSTSPVYVSDANDIQSELIEEIFKNEIAQPNSEIVYVVVLPPYVGTIEHGFSGYHSFTNLSGHYVPYAVIAEQAPPSTLANPLFPTAQWRPRDYLIAHELYEATTDFIPGLGYTTGACGASDEVADLCQQFFSDPIDGYTVATFWSNAANGCVGPASLDTAVPIPGDQCGLNCAENPDTLQKVCRERSCACPPGEHMCPNGCMLNKYICEIQ